MQPIAAGREAGLSSRTVPRGKRIVLTTCGSFEDLTRAAEGADLIVSHAITYAARLVAEVRGLPWVSTALQPMVFCSAYDPPVPPQAPGAAVLYRLGPRVNGPLFDLLKKQLRRM